MMPKEDLLSLLMNQYSKLSNHNVQDSEPVQKSLHKIPETDPKTAPTPFPEPEDIPPSQRPKPVLSGQLAVHLAKQPPRDVVPDSMHLTTESTPWTIDDVQTKAAVAMSLVLASHLAKFAITSLSETQLNRARDSLLHEMKASDAVNIEVEAYELLSWFAGAIDESWKKKAETPANLTKGETSQAALIQIIQSAIQDHRDLNMEYYTSSRAKFSERIITPIEISAEKYLIAFCHTRKEERVFRLSRIVALTPITDGSNSEPLLSYPNLEDTRVPQLPEPESPQPKRTKSRSNAAKKATKSPKKTATEKANSSDIKPDSNHQKQQRTLFETPTSPAKTKPNNKQTFLPGFDDK